MEYYYSYTVTDIIFDLRVKKELHFILFLVQICHMTSKELEL